MQRILIHARVLFTAGLSLVLASTLASHARAVDYYIDPTNGADSNNGRSEGAAWQSLAKASAQNFNAGDRILLKRGETFPGKLDIKFELSGSAANPIKIDSYGSSPNKPLIDATGLTGGAIELGYSEHIHVNDLEITGQGVLVETWGTAARAYPGLQFTNLHIRDVPDQGIKMVVANEGDRFFSDVVISNNVIERTGGNGISINKWKGAALYPNNVYHQNVTITGNTLDSLGGAGIQIGKIQNGSVDNNQVNDSGNDPAVGGSGLWTWYVDGFMVEKNIFQGARGETDAAGAHMDIGTRNTIFQHNLSIDNEGGFVEILGRAENNAYRYNVSINDGSRVLGQNGARQHGKTFWFGGYTGQGDPREGAFDNYVYNNTVFVDSSIVSNYKMEDTVSGGLFANNLIYVEGSADDISPDWPGGPGTGVIFDNNLVFEDKVPAAAFNTFVNNWDADPEFVNAGGLNPEDYVPLNSNEIVDRGINLYNIPGDADGIPGGFAVTEDFFGNPIIGLPDIGAFELTPAMLGDFDADGETNLADLLMWQRGESPNPSSLIDLVLWQANAGDNQAAASSVAAIPEPVGLAMIATGLFALFTPTRKSRRASHAF